MKKGFIVIIAGPTGVGESTVTKALMKKFKNSVRMVTYTSRPKRLQEKNHVDYHFITKKQFLAGIKKEHFLEHTHIKNRDHYYGTKKKDFENLLKKGKVIFFNCDLPGLRGVKKVFPKNNVSLFINYERFSQVRTRLLHREPDMTPGTLDIRQNNAAQEMIERKFYDYVVVNRHNQLKKTVERADKIIKSALNKDCYKTLDIS